MKCLFFLLACFSLSSTAEDTDAANGIAETMENQGTMELARTIQVPYFENGKFKGYLEEPVPSDELTDRSPASESERGVTVESPEEPQN